MPSPTTSPIESEAPRCAPRSLTTAGAPLSVQEDGEGLAEQDRPPGAVLEVLDPRHRLPAAPQRPHGLLAARSLHRISFAHRLPPTSVSLSSYVSALPTVLPR